MSEDTYGWVHMAIIFILFFSHYPNSYISVVYLTSTLQNYEIRIALLMD